MSEPATAHASLSATGYADGLGRRTLEFDREAGGMLERLQLRAEFSAFEASLRQRADRFASFDDARFARVRGVEREPTGTLSVRSTYVAGDRLCDLLDAAIYLPAHEATSPSVDAALGFLLEVLGALHAFHSNTGFAHGAVAPGRMTLTSSGDVVLLDALFGHAIERLQFSRGHLWTEFGIAVPVGTANIRVDAAADISQASLAAMMIVLGRPLRHNDYPAALPALMTEVVEIAQIRGSTRFAGDLHKFLHRTLPLPARRAHASAEEAAAEVRQIAREIGVQRCRAALAAFVGDVNRVISEARGGDTTTPRESSFDSAAVRVPAVAFDESPISIEEPVIDSPAEDGVPERFRAPSIEEFTSVVEAEPVPALPSIEETPAIEPSYAPPPEPAYTPAAPEPDPEPVALAREIAPPPQSTPRPPERPPEPVVVALPPPPEEPRPEIELRQPESAPADSKRGRRNARRHRDKLRSYAEPKPAPAPPPPPPVRPPLVIPTPAFAAVAPLPSVAPPAPQPRRIGQPLRDESPIAAPIVQAPPIMPVPVEPPAAPQPIAPPIAFRNDPGGFTAATFKNEPAPVRQNAIAFKQDPAPMHRSETFAPRTQEWREPQNFSFGAYPEREAAEKKRSLPWKLLAAAVVVIAVGVGAGRKYLPGNEAAAAAPPEPSNEVVAAAKAAESSEKVGTVVLTTEPAGAHVLLDGKEMGDSPLTLENVPAGKHAITFVTASASVKRIVRVDAAKTISLDVAVFSGWIAVYSPIPLDVSENGRAIGSSEQGRLMLSPGRHQLTLANTELGYSTVQTVEIEPGEEHPVSIEPKGELSANAVPWAEVWMNGKKIGDTPFASLEVPLGTHELVFKNPQFPDRHVTVTVTASPAVTASVDFSKQ